MKKNGFTLAEVLITLAIIGVVATLTLPALMTNTAEQQAKTALKKGINTLTEAAQTNQAIAGFDYASLKSADTTAETQSLYGLLDARTNVDYRLSKLATTGTEAAKVDKASANYVVFFRDGSALAFNPAQTVNNAAGPRGITISELQDDGLAYGIAAVYDTNGAKGPNLLSNCNGLTTVQAGDTLDDRRIPDSEGNVPDVCAEKANRVIKDQFGVRLRGGFAVPNGAASAWAFEN